MASNLALMLLIAIALVGRLAATPLSDAAAFTELLTSSESLFDEAFFDLVGESNGLWEAGSNEYFKDKSKGYLSSLCGVSLGAFGENAPSNSNDVSMEEILDALDIKEGKISAQKSSKVKNPMGKLFGYDDPWPLLPQAKWPANITKTLPKSFDAREQWGDICPSLREIRDQGRCGSCWAVSMTSASRDRVCLSSNGQKRVYLSSSDLLSCCGYRCGDGCNGASGLDSGWNYWIHQGLVTGSDYLIHTDSDVSDTNKLGVCWPYEFPPCSVKDNTTMNGLTNDCDTSGLPQTPQCRSSCVDSSLEWKDQKSYGRIAYSLPRNEEQIRAEIYMNGPVQAAFVVYEDFTAYKSGIYRHLKGKDVGGHAIKIVGWGEEEVPKEDGSKELTKYWIIANSWSKGWAKEGGFFRMLRGANECGIESLVFAGLP